MAEASRAVRRFPAPDLWRVLEIAYWGRVSLVQYYRCPPEHLWEDAMTQNVMAWDDPLGRLVSAPPGAGSPTMVVSVLSAPNRRMKWVLVAADTVAGLGRTKSKCGISCRLMPSNEGIRYWRTLCCILVSMGCILVSMVIVFGALDRTTFWLTKAAPWRLYRRRMVFALSGRWDRVGMIVTASGMGRSASLSPLPFCAFAACPFPA